jgi:hypothetical protein
MRIQTVAIFLLSVLFCFCKQPDKSTPAQGDDTTSTGPSRLGRNTADAVQVDDISAVREYVLAEWKKHENDPSWSWASSFTDGQGHTLQGGVEVGELFKTGYRSALLSWSDSESTIHIAVLNWENGTGWNAVFSAQRLPVDKSPAAMQDDFLFLRDYNMDGWNDIEVVLTISNKTKEGFHRSKLWLVGPDHFTTVQGFEQINSPELDASTKTIYAFNGGECPDDLMVFEAWQLVQNEVQLSKTTSIDCCSPGGSNCLVSVDGKGKLPVPSARLYIYVPKYYHKWLQKKIGN